MSTTVSEYDAIEIGIEFAKAKGIKNFTFDKILPPDVENTTGTFLSNDWVVFLNLVETNEFFEDEKSVAIILVNRVSGYARSFETL